MEIKITNQALVDKFLDFIRDLTPEDNIAILHDMDADGLCSAFLFKKALGTLGIEPKIIQHIKESPEGTYFTSFIKRKLEEENINKIMVLDKPAGSSLEKDPDLLQSLERICIVDHHQFKNDCNSEKVVFINPTLFIEGVEPSQYCTAKITYDLINKIIDISGFDWICAAAVISDYSYKTWKEFVDSVHQKHNLEVKEDIHTSKIGILCGLINNSAAIGDSEFSKIISRLESVNNVDEALEELKEFEIISKEIEKFVDNYKEHSEIYEDKELILMEIETDFSKVGSPVSTIISTKIPITVIVLRKDKDELIHISARRQDKKYDMAKLCKTLCGDLGGQGGGHIPASGGQFPLNKLNDFKKLVLERIEEFKVEEKGE